jgi:hypothetical protein
MLRLRDIHACEVAPAVAPAPEAPISALDGGGNLRMVI